MSRRFVVIAISLIVLSLGVRLFSRQEVVDRVGLPMTIEDLAENKEYIVLSPVVTSFTKFQEQAGLQSIMIVEKAESKEEFKEVKMFVLSNKNVKKEDYENLTFGTIITRKGEEINLEPPKENSVLEIEEKRT